MMLLMRPHPFSMYYNDKGVVMIVQQDCHANSPHCRESSHPSQQTIPNNKHCLRASSLLYLFNSCPCFTGAPHLTTSHAPTQQHITSGAMTSRNKIKSRLLPLLGDPLMHLARTRERPAFIIPTLALHCSRLTGIVGFQFYNYGPPINFIMATTLYQVSTLTGKMTW